MTKTKKVVVIGGGLGGLSAAVSMAQSGFDVSLYEKNNHLGGKLNRLEKDGFGFDLGPSILTMKSIFQNLFDKSQVDMEDYFKSIRLDLEWRSFFSDGSIIDLYGDLDKMGQNNSDLTEKDMEEYTEFLEYCKQLYDITEDGYLGEGLDDLSDIIRYHGVVKAGTAFDVFSTMFEAIEKRISNPKLQKILAYFIKYVGSSAYDAPAILNMMIYMQHLTGIWYVPGGMHHIAEGIVKLGEENGVQFHTNQEVVKLHKENGQVVAAELADGTLIYADYFISNMEVIPAYESLLNETEKFTEKLEEKFEPAASGFVAHLGVEGSYPQLAHHNFFFAEDLEENFKQIFHDQILPDDPTIYLVNVNKTDETQTKPGYENIKILPHIPYIPDKPFTKEEYEAFEDRVFEKLERMGLTDLRKRTVTKNIWLPEDIQKNYYSHRGAIYGTVSDRKKNRGFKHPKHSELYDNLYFVGGTVNPGGGMPMVTMSGQQVHAEIMNRENKS